MRTDNKATETHRRFKIKKINQKNQISEIEGQIAHLEARRETLNEQLQLLGKERQDLQDRVSEAKERYAELTQSKLAANQQASAQGSIGLMLFSNEVLRIQRHLQDLRDRLLFKIPEQQSQYQTDLKELGIKIQNQQARLNEARTKLEQLAAEEQSAVENHQSKIQERRIRIRALQSQLDNHIVTRVVAPPEFSEGAVSPNLKLNTALGFVLGLFLSVFLAFLYEFWRNNRERILAD